MTISRTINLADRVLLRNVSGQPVYAETARIPENVLASLVEGGIKIILTNAFNGGGKDLPEADKLAQMQKRLDAWYKGEYVVVERDSAYGPMKEAYIDETRARTGASVKEVEAEIVKAVRDAFGEKEKATFGRFLDALAQAIAKARNLDVAETRGKLEAKYARLAEEAAKARSAASAKLDVTGISLD